MKKVNFKSILEEMPQSNVYNRHVKVPEGVTKDWFEKSEAKRILCTINHNETYSCALMPYGNGQSFINVNRNLCKKLGIEIGSELDIQIIKDEGKYGIPIPEEMEVLLEQDEEGSKLFHALTPGKQRSLLHVIGIPKSTDIRLRKAIITLNYLKSVNGKLDFKEYNQAQKDWNK